MSEIPTYISNNNERGPEMLDFDSMDTKLNYAKAKFMLSIVFGILYLIISFFTGFMAKGQGTESISGV